MWRAVLTVGDGFPTDGFVSGHGALSDAEFEYESEQFTIGQLYVTEVMVVLAGLKGALLFDVSRRPSDTAVKRLRLHVCGEAFDLKDNTLIPDQATMPVVTIQWHGADLVWYPGSNLAVALSETRNTPATGRPSVTGAAVTGQTLSADRSAIADADGTTQADAGDAGYAWAWQWVHVDGMTETDIAGATGDTYTPVAADEGKLVAVRVTFTDDLDYEEAVTSEPVGPVSDEAPDATGQPVIDGTPQDGQELTTGKGDMADDDDLPTTTFPDGLHVPVGAGGGRDGHGHRRRDDADLHAGAGRRGPPAQGGGELHRRRRHGGDARERRDGGGGGGGGGLRGGPARLGVVHHPDRGGEPGGQRHELRLPEQRLRRARRPGLRPWAGVLHGAGAVDMGRRCNGSDGVVIDFSDPPGRVPHGPVFNFGGTTFTANAASEHSSENTRYRWNRPADFEWLDGQKVTVSMKNPNTPATGVPTGRDGGRRADRGHLGHADADHGTSTRARRRRRARTRWRRWTAAPVGRRLRA